MDQYYFEDGYIEASYFGYLAEARVDLRPYIEDNYLYPPQYFEYYGLAASFTAELTEIVGEVIEALGSWSATFTQTATISHIEGSDLFAFSEAAITITVERIRDNNVAVSTVFATNIDAVRYRDITGDESSAFSLEALGQRSRDAIMAAQAAFSFDCTGARIRFSVADAGVAASLTATISHIESVDIVVENFASLTATANFTVDNVSAMSTQASVDADLTYVIGKLEASANSKFTVIARAESRYNDWVYITGGTINTSVKKFGTGSLSGKALYYASNEDLIQDRFTIDAWVYITQDINNGNFFVYRHESFIRNYVTLGYSPALTDRGFPTGRQNFFHTIRTNLGGTVGDDYLRTENAFGINTWHHVALVMNTNNNQVQVYVNGGRQRVQINQTGSYVNTAQLGDVQFDFDQPKRAEVGHASDTYVDELRISGGYTDIFLGTLPQNYTVPTQPYTSNVIGKKFLVHYDTNFRNDLSELENAVANLSSQSNLTASAFVFYQNNTADLTATTTVSASAAVDRGAELTAFTTGSLQIDAVRIRFSDSDISSEATVSTDAEKIVTVSSDFAVEADISATAARSRDNDIATDSIATQITVVAKTGNTLVDVAVAASLTATAVMITDQLADLLVFGNVTVSAERIRFADSTQTLVANLSATASRTRPFEIALASEFAESANVAKITDVESTLSSEFNLEAASTGTIDFIALFATLGTLTINETLFKNFDSQLSVIATQTTDTTDSLNKRAEAVLSASTSLAATATRIQQAEIATESIATQLAAVAKIGRVVTAMDVVADITADFEKIGRLESDIAAVTTQSTIAQKTTDIDSGLLVISNFQADGTTNIVGEGSTAATFSQSTTVVKTAVTDVSCNLEFTLTSSAERSRPFAALVMSMGTLSVTATRIRETDSDISGISDVFALIGKIVQAECNFGALFSPSVSIRKIFINIYVYRIPQEIRVYRVPEDRRVYTIQEETRTYTIRR